MSSPENPVWFMLAFLTRIQWFTMPSVVVLTAVSHPCFGASLTSGTTLRAVIGASGHYQTSSGWAVGWTAGLPFAGSSSIGNTTLVSGFWLPRSVPTIDAPDPRTMPPLHFSLEAARPNPFATTVIFRFAVPASNEARERIGLRVYDVAGRVVADWSGDSWSAGVHEVRWDGSDLHGRRLASGTYFLHMDVRGFQTTRRITLIR